MGKHHVLGFRMARELKNKIALAKMENDDAMTEIRLKLKRRLRCSRGREQASRAVS